MSHWLDDVFNISGKTNVFTFTCERPNYPVPFDLEIKKIIFNPPATIVFWSDGTKTVVKCAKNERFDAEKGVAMAIAKKFLPKQYGRKLAAMTDKAFSKYDDTVRKSLNRIRKKDTEKKQCWNCKYKSLSFWDIPCRNCRSTRDRSEWVQEEK